MRAGHRLARPNARALKVSRRGWQGVYKILQQHGYRVGIVQNPTISLDDDVAVTKRLIAAQPGPVVLVGHSYGAW